VARGPAQRLYGFAANYDVPEVEFRETVRLYGDSLDAARAHHRQGEHQESHYLRCVHCHGMKRIRSRADLLEHTRPPGHRGPWPIVLWCWSCGDWRCNRRKCAGCEGSSLNRLRKLDAIREHVHEHKKRVQMDAVRACLESGEPWRGMNLEQGERIVVAVKR